MCAVLLEAWLAMARGGRVAGTPAARPGGLDVHHERHHGRLGLTNLVTARLREAAGDLPGAARAIGRVRVALPVSPTYWSTYLLEGSAE